MRTQSTASAASVASEAEESSNIARRANILAVSGSLQAKSSNGALLHALASMIGERGIVQFSQALHVLPPFNPDLEAQAPPREALEWGAELAAADAVVIATPEYAFGIPGALKNALDWVVGSGEFVHKRVALIGASPLGTGANHALEALDRTIRVMTADVVSTLSIPFVRTKIDETGAISDTELRAALEEMATRLVSPSSSVFGAP
jgi:NAD(P)H-dependent FMN reductase